MLEKLTGFINSALHQSGGRSVVGIDVGTSSVKVVQLRKERGVAILETYGELSLGPYAGLEIGRATNLPQEKLAEAINNVLKESNVTTKSCGVSIPFTSSLVSLIELPAVDSRKLASMIPIEARKYIPVPISEVQLDWFVVPEGEVKFLYGGADSPDKQETAEQKPQKTYVLLVAIHNEMLRRYTESLALTTLQPSFYEIEIFSTIRSTLERGVSPVAIIDIGAAATKVYVVEFGIVLSSHVIAKGSQDITLALANTNHVSIAKAEELKRNAGIEGEVGQSGTEASGVSHIATLTMEYIFMEAHRSLLNFQKKHNQAISKVVLSGGGASIHGLVDLAAKQLEMKVELANPFSNTRAPAFLDNVLKEAGPEFAVAVGLAMRKLQEMG